MSTSPSPETEVSTRSYVGPWQITYADGRPVMIETWESKGLARIHSTYWITQSGEPDAAPDRPRGDHHL